MDYTKAKECAKRNVEKQIAESMMQVKAVKEEISSDKPLSIKLDALWSNAQLVYLELNKNFAPGFTDGVKEFISEVIDTSYELGKHYQGRIDVVAPDKINDREVRSSVKLDFVKKELSNIFFQGGCEKTSVGLIENATDIIRIFVRYSFNLGVTSLNE